MVIKYIHSVQKGIPHHVSTSVAWKETTNGGWNGAAEGQGQNVFNKTSLFIMQIMLCFTLCEPEK